MTLVHVGAGGVIEVGNDLVNPVALLQRPPPVEVSAMSRGKSNQCVVERGVGSPATASAPSLPVTHAQAFHAEYMEVARLQTLLSAPPSGFLGIVYHGRTSGNPGGTGAIPVVSLDLPQLSAPPLAEVWTSPLPVTYHQAEGIHCAMNDEVLFGVLQVAEPPGALLDAVTCKRIDTCLFGHVLWGILISCGCGTIFLPSIVSPTGWNGISAFARAGTRRWPRGLRDFLEPCLPGLPSGHCPAR